MKKLSVKRALIGSVMSLLVCIAMFAGTTFAWFTDSAKNTGNKITAGTLDLELSLYNPAASQFENISNSTTPIFSVENWAPGSEELQSATIMIENTGSLDFEVSLDFVSTGDSKLAEVIEVYKSWTNPTVALGAAPATKAELDEALTNHEYAGPVTLEYALKATQYRGIVESGEKIYLGVAMYLPGIVGNEYQGLDAEFDFVVRAKQIKGEFEDLPNEGFRTPVGAIFQPAQYDGKQEVSMTIDNTSVTIPTSAIADTTAPVEVEITPAVATAGASSVLKVESEDVQVYDIDVTNIKSDAVDPIAINLFVGKGLDESKMAFYHNDELIDFEYNATTGVLSFSSTSFSPFTLLVSDTIAVAGYQNLKYALDKGYADITVVGEVEVDSPNCEDRLIIQEDTTITLDAEIVMSGSNNNFAALYVGANDGDAKYVTGLKTVDVTINATENGGIYSNWYCVNVAGNSNVTINGGTYFGTTTAIQAHKGYAIINGGEYRVTPYKESHRYTLNCKDIDYKNGIAGFVVNGGKFYKYDPADSKSENPAGNFVADGYVSYQDGDYYVVDDTVKVDTAEELQNAIDKGYADITVVADIENSESFTVADGQEVTVTLLDGVTVAGSGYDGTFYVTNGTLTLNGNGTIVGKLDREYSMAVWACSANAKVVINGNTFTNEGYPESNQFDMIYSKEGALIEINGGTFNCYTPKWTLNLKDNSGAEIVVSGGSFYQYDPANSKGENPVANLVADGYVSALDGDYYVVTAE